MPSGSHARFHGAQRSAFTTRAQKSLTAAGSQHRALDGVVFKNYYIDKAGRKSMKPFSGLGLMQTKAFLALGCGTLGLYQYAGHKSDAPYDGRDENFYRRLRHDYLTSLKATVEGILSPGTPLPWEQPRIVEIPKIKLPLEICVADVVESRDGLEPDSEGKTRTLTIADLDQRTAAAAGATILSSYLAPRFSCTVVGYRPGFSIPKILSALRQATPAPQPGFLLCADIKGYFDYIPRQRCLEALAEMTAVTPDSELIQYTCALV